MIVSIKLNYLRKGLAIMANKGQKFKRYPSELKRKVIAERTEKHTPFLELAYKFGVSSQESVMQWMKKYERFGEASFNDKRGTATAKTSALKGRPKKKFDSEEAKVKYLSLVKERNRKLTLEKRRLARLRKKRAADKIAQNAADKLKVY
jgi:transposase-like protein